MTAAELLRSLDKSATAGEWVEVGKSVRVRGTGDSTGAPNGYGGGVCNCLGGAFDAPKNDEQNVAARTNARLIATTRNLLPEIAALVEAVERMDDPSGGPGPVRDALAALNAKAAELGGK